MATDPPRTRDRILAAAMDLFGRQGYGPTTIAQIEHAAGLSGGAGGLYRHFPSKKALLVEGLRRQTASDDALPAALGDPERLAALPLVERLQTLGRAGLARLEQERDLNRVLLRDLAQFPELLEQVRQQELLAVFGGLRDWLAAQPEARPDADLDALAAVLLAAVSHFWIMRDVYDGAHPHELEADRFLGMLSTMAAAALTGADEPG